MTQIADLAYLNSLYAASEDPWHLRSGWYEERKRALTMASLPKARYDSIFEPGCSVGELTAQLARRSERVLAVDFHHDAVAATRERTTHLSNVEVRRMLLPQEWPTGEQFDLVVLSEIGYFFTASAWAQLCAAVSASLAPEATVLACHWQHDFNERTLATETLHGLLDSVLGLHQQTQIADADFSIGVWTTTQRTVAQTEGLACLG